jgi:negative regulator of sigma-B (phosphoserine phosphatase)
MMQLVRLNWSSLELGHATRPCSGEVECGDAIWTYAAPDELRMAVIDGLGHGPAAAQAAAQTVEAIAEAEWKDLAMVMRSCDTALRGTRGAAVALLKLRRDGRAEHCGIGNIALAFCGQAATGCYARPGIVGARPRKIQVDQFELKTGALMFVHSDGVSQRMLPEQHVGESVDRIAELVLERWGRDHDDASCLVIRRRMVD